MDKSARDIKEYSDKRERLTDCYIVAMLLVFPLFTGFSGYARLTLSKYLFFVIITLIWLVSLVFLSLRQRELPHVPRAVLIPALCFMLANLASALLSEHFPKTLLGAGRYDGLLTQLLYGCILIGACAFARPKPLHFAALGISAALCCVTAVFQVFDFNIFFLFPNDYSYYDAHIKYTGEFLGTMGNVDVLSAFLCLCIPVFFTVLLRETDKRCLALLVPLFLSSLTLVFSATAGGAAAAAGWALVCVPALCTSAALLRRALLLAPAVLCGAALALCFDGGVTDGAFSFRLELTLPAFALFAASVLCVLLSLLLGAVFRGKDAKPVKALYVTAACAAVCALVFAYFYDGTSGTLYELSQVLHGNIEDSFGSSRILIWRSVLESVPQNLLLGAGPDTLPLYIDIEFSRYIPETGDTLATFVDNAHNVPLGYLAGSGVLGLMSFLSAVAAALLALRNGGRFGAALAGGAVCYSIHSLFGLGLPIVAPIFWIFLGSLASYHRRGAPER